MTVVYNEDSHQIKVFDPAGTMIFIASCWNATVADNVWRYPDAGCPPGTYTLGPPSPNTTTHDELSMGPTFIPVNDIPGHDGIGIHGGGSCNQTVEAALAPRQRICPTENCFRMYNEDLLALAKLIPDGGSMFIVHQSEAA